MENKSEVREFILLGLTSDHSQQRLLFVFFLLLYMACLLGNGAILTIVLASPQLHTPMYFFLGNLSCQDICISTVTVPKILSGFLMAHQTTSYIECLIQLHFFHFLGCSEAILLGIMAYDRYVAICNPLRYSVIMNKEVCLMLAVATWTASFCYALMNTIMTSRLWFCGRNVVQHFVCDIKPLLELACSSTALNLTLLNVVVGLIAVASFFVTLLSYFYIISFLFFKFQTWQSRWKAFSTCVSHLTVVTLYLVPPILNYMLPSTGNSSEREMIITLAYVIITPVLNPLIYTLRNQDVKSSLSKIITRKLLTGRI
ncbi:olfactory receptor 12D1-like [Tiliqua scincoides]|uniref:olfactory receptor 12D1-like n=1 Tax=Tiliqua scincoides TaxID=71010 RepID=UPI0034634E68